MAVLGVKVKKRTALRAKFPLPPPAFPLCHLVNVKIKSSMLGNYIESWHKKILQCFSPARTMQDFLHIAEGCT
jgi:hypothetical protein